MALISYDQTSAKDIVRGCHLHRVSVLVRVAQHTLVEDVMMRAATNVDRVMMLRDESTIDKHIEARASSVRLKAIDHEVGVLVPGLDIRKVTILK